MPQFSLQPVGIDFLRVEAKFINLGLFFLFNIPTSLQRASLICLLPFLLIAVFIISENVLVFIAIRVALIKNHRHAGLFIQVIPHPSLSVVAKVCDLLPQIHQIGKLFGGD